MHTASFTNCPTHRYRVSENGRLILNAILSAHRATIRQFMAPAA